jgi:hypothetical protein
MSAKLPILTVLFTLALLLQPGPTPSTTSGTPAAPSPQQAVETLLKPFYVQDAGLSSSCNALSGQFQGCPITARLLNRLRTATENGNIISRSQNPPQDVRYTLLDNDGQTTHVNTTWNFASSSYAITFTAVKIAEGWQVDDSFCSGQPDTSLFNPPAGPCPTSAVINTHVPDTTPASLGTATVSLPGVPNTGTNEHDAFIPLLTTLAVLTAVAGLFVALNSRRSRAPR